MLISAKLYNCIIVLVFCNTNNGIIYNLISAFIQTAINDQEVETDISFDKDMQVMASFLEFAEYQPGFPLDVSFEENKSYSQLASHSSDSKNFATIFMDYVFTTYNQKQKKLNKNFDHNPLEQERVLNQFQHLQIKLLQFSNCARYSYSCVLGEFGSPAIGKAEASIVYTALVASLMCEENVEDKYVCGLLHSLSDCVNFGRAENYKYNFHGQSFSTKEDEIWFFLAILQQTFLDCEMQRCVGSYLMRNAKLKLIQTFNNFNTSHDHDIRVEALMASVAPHNISEKLLQKLRQKIDITKMPHWHVSKSFIKNGTDKSTTKSMDVTANSLALLALVNQTAELYDKSKIDFSRLVEWITEQQISDKRFQTSIVSFMQCLKQEEILGEAFYAWRALYRHSERQKNPLELKNVRIQLLNAGISVREYSNKDMPFSLQLPANSRNFTLRTVGDGKIVLGVRVLEKAKKRSKRENDNAPVIEIATTQSRLSHINNVVVQLICIRTRSKSIETLEIEHNLYTGFSTDFSRMKILANSSGVTLIGLQRVYVGGIYFIITGISSEIPACYELEIKEPDGSYTAEYLAPVVVHARCNQMFGQAILYASEIKTIFEVRKKRHHIKNRLNRAALPPGTDLVDTICLDYGSCTCSELACSTKCLTCKRKKNATELNKELISQIKSYGKFGIIATLISSKSILIGNENYTRAVMNVGYSIDRKLLFGCAPKTDQFILWIRACNKRSCTKLVNEKLYLLVGSEKGFFEDSISTTEELQANSTQIILKHYLLHDDDRLEGGITYEDSSKSNSTCHQVIKELLLLHISCN